MKVSIGFITTEGYLQNIKNLEGKLKESCDFYYYIVKDDKDIIAKYNEHYNDVDAFILNGLLIHSILKKNLDTIDKPCYNITDDLANIYKQLLTIFVKNPRIDPSRVYIDFTNKDLGFSLEEIFSQDNMPYLIPLDFKDRDSIPQNVFNNHMELWNQDKIDLSITKFGMLLDRFDKEEIKYEFIPPSNEYLEEFFIKIIEEVRLEKLSKNKAAIIYIEILNKTLIRAQDYELELSYLQLLRETIKFTRDHDFDFVINRKDKHIEIITTIEEILKLTNNLTSSPIQNYLEEKLDEKFSIGFGTGKNFSQANANALNALIYAKDYDQGSSVYVSENQNVLTLSKFESISYNQRPTPKIQILSEKLDINNIYLQKLIGFCSKMGRNYISARELANLLGVTDRTANRTLNKVLDNGGADTFIEKRGNKKGRPAKYYLFKFIDSNGKILKKFTN